MQRSTYHFSSFDDVPFNVIAIAKGFAMANGKGSTAQHSTAQHSTAQHSAAQRSTAQHSTAAQHRATA